MQQRVATNFLIATADTGGGHRSATTAIIEGFRRYLPNPKREIRILRPIEESHFLTQAFGELYNYLLRHHQHLVEYYYRFIGWARPNDSPTLYRLVQPYLHRAFTTAEPHAIISVHPMTQHFIARALRASNLHLPLITVVTDPCYGFWPGWACQDVQRYLVATDGSRQQLLDYGVPAEKISVTGMPVHPKFQSPDAHKQRESRLALGLAPDKFTVFINAGWIGGGNIPRIFSHFLNEGHQAGELQAVFLAGRNERLLRWAQQRAPHAQFPVQVLGHTDSIERLMQASDVMVSKLGGLTTFEALETRLPIIADITSPPMPQEAETVRYLLDHRAGMGLEDPRDLTPMLHTLMQNPARMQELRTAAGQLATPGATRRIVEEIMQVCADYRY